MTIGRLLACCFSPAILLSQAMPDQMVNTAYREAMNLRSLVRGGSASPIWLDNHRFYFEDNAVDEPRTFLVDVEANTKVPFVPSRPPALDRSARPTGINSPDKMAVAFLRDRNVWFQSTDGVPRAVTTDGNREHFYGSLTSRSDALMWAPDGRHLLLQKIDTSGVRRYPLLTFFTRNNPEVPDEEINTDKVLPRAGEKLPTATLKILDAHSGQLRQVEMQETDATLRFLSWPEGSKEAFVLQTTRDAKRMTIYGVDGETGKCRVVLNETSATFLMSPEGRTEYSFQMLTDGKQFLWGSERDGWTHLYLYSTDGILKRKITEGNFPVTRVVAVSEDGWVYITAHAEPRTYDTHLYRVRIDGGNLEKLTDGNGFHSVSFSPDKKYFVDNWSSIDQAPTAELRAADGHLMQVLSRASLAEAVRRGWTAPEEFHVRAADGVTEIRGVLFKPWNLDRGRKYPVVDLIYAGPLITWAPRSFFGEPRGMSSVQAQALAQLGFVVMALDGRGTPERSKAFQDVVYRNIGIHEIPDHVSALRQLAGQRSYMDIARVGVVGHSWGGYFTLRAMFTAPEVFKVGVSWSPVVDLWVEAPDVEPYMDLPSNNREGYERGSNLRLVQNLQGNLLIIHGTSDAGAPLSGTMRLIAALTEAGKPYDLALLVHGGHNDVALSSYVQERTIAYLVAHLKP